jgi:hypothetical protein
LIFAPEISIVIYGYRRIYIREQIKEEKTVFLSFGLNMKTVLSKDKPASKAKGYILNGLSLKKEQKM